MVDNTHTPDPYNLVDLPTEYWSIDKIKPYERNTKVHSKEHIAKLKTSIATDGLYDALIIDREGVLIAGHGRFQALVELGQTTVPVKHAAHLTKAQADAARISHNKTASTEYDSGFLAEEVRRLSESGEIDLTTIGLDEHELNFLVDDLGDMNMDSISTDLDQDIDDQEDETERKVAATDASDEKLVKAFGFNSVPIAAVKSVRRFMADIETETGKSGADAFVDWVNART